MTTVTIQRPQRWESKVIEFTANALADATIAGGTPPPALVISGAEGWQPYAVTMYTIYNRPGGPIVYHVWLRRPLPPAAKGYQDKLPAECPG